MLVERGWITGEQLIRAIQSQRMVGGRLGTCLLEMDVLDEDTLLDALSVQLGVPSVSVERLRYIDEKHLGLVPAKVASRCLAVPFASNDTEVQIATLSVRNLGFLDELAFCTERKVVPHIANEVRIYEALEKYYGYELPKRYGHLLDRLNRSRYLWDESAKILLRGKGQEVDWSSLEDAFGEADPGGPVRGLVQAASGRSHHGLRAPVRTGGSPVPAGGPSGLAPLPATVQQPSPAAAGPAASSPAASSPAASSQTVPAAAAAAPAASVAAAPQAAPAQVASPAASPFPGQTAVARAGAAAPVPVVVPDATGAEDAPPLGPRPVGRAEPAADGSEDATVLLARSPLAEQREPARVEAAAPEAGTREAGATQVGAPEGGNSEGKALDALSAETLDDVDRLLGGTSNPHQIADVMLGFASRTFSRVALFSAKPESGGHRLRGWKIRGEGVDTTLFSSFEVGADESSMFSEVRAITPWRVGPMAPGPIHRKLASCWGGEFPAACLLVPVSLRGRMACLLYGDRGAGGIDNVDPNEFRRLALKAAMAFELCILRKKIQDV